MKKDQMTLAYVNMYAVFGAIPKLCELIPEARELIAGQNITLGFSVKGGPAATLVFRDGVCSLREGAAGAVIRLGFSTPEKFNGMIDGTVTPIPNLRGLFHLGFLLRHFMPLTDILSRYLRASDADLADGEFFNRSTELMLHVIAGAVATIGNHDTVGRVSASYIKDGNIFVGIADGPSVAVAAKDHRLAVISEPIGQKKCLSYMIFRDMHTARDLFDGRVNAVVSVGLGDIRIGGMISQIDNVNRILDRVSYYLA